ncbi:hypothetical protein ACS0TY_021827 [Phlomoides rotata]
MLDSLDMRRDVQQIFKMTPHDKQVMMFSATLSKEIRPVCKKFMEDVMSYGQSLNLEVHISIFPNSCRRQLAKNAAADALYTCHVVFIYATDK